MMVSVYTRLFVSIFRDAYTVVWSLLVPLGLLVGLGLYFHSVEYRSILISSTLSITVLFTNFNTPAFFILKQRNKGVYKLLKATPFQTYKFIVCLALATNTISFLLSILMLTLSSVVLGASFTIGQIASILLMMILGGFCFVCLGFFVANISKNENHVGMFTNLIQFPMIFTSGAFFSMDKAPQWLKMLGDVMPFHYLIAFMENMIIANRFATASLGVFTVFVMLNFILSVKTFRFE